MRKINVLIGVVGSGKSTWVSNNIDKIDKVFASDEYRENIFGTLKKQTKQDHNIVFSQLYHDVDQYVATHDTFNIVLDATNLSRKKRSHFYRTMKRHDVTVNAIVFTRPLHYLKDINEKRSSYKKVPDDVIDSMYENMTIPFIHVDCDTVDMVGEPLFYEIDFKHDYVDLDTVKHHAMPALHDEIDKLYQSHNSHYHKESIDEHINRTISHSRGQDGMFYVALFHDLGKGVTKKPNGNGTSNYINHENVGALYLFNYLMIYHKAHYIECGEQLVKRVAYHMLPFRGIKQHKRQHLGINHDLWQKIQYFNQIDVMSSEQ